MQKTAVFIVWPQDSQSDSSNGRMTLAHAADFRSGPEFVYGRLLRFARFFESLDGGLDTDLVAEFKAVRDGFCLSETLKHLKRKPEMRRDVSRLGAACCLPQKYELPAAAPHPA